MCSGMQTGSPPQQKNMLEELVLMEQMPFSSASEFLRNHSASVPSFAEPWALTHWFALK